ncbi:MAG: threonine ammonia-lyase [Lachnospiraceae bacterium]|nr:threonine ammonia-lyase [Lachnospiraceae bacterium]
MVDISLEEFKEAEKLLMPIIHRTETLFSNSFSKIAGSNVYLKPENLQKTASFKIRGASYKIMKLQQKGEHRNVVSASAGNHAQGVAYAARKAGVKAKIVMPVSTPLMKIEATKSYGAEIVLSGTGFDEAFAEAMKINALENACFIHPYNDIDVITGQGTVGLEILEDYPDTDIILVPAGGGGLLAGIATVAKKMKPDVKVIGVQAETANAICRSFREKKHIVTDTADTIADGIAVKNPGEICLDLIFQNVDEMLEVGNEDIDIAILTMVERTKLITEPAGAASIAALMKYKDRFKGKNVVCILSGGNADTWKIHRYLEVGLIKTDRWVTFEAMIKAKQGSMPKLTDIIVNQCGTTLMDITLDRYAETNPDLIACRVTCEVRNAEHKKELIQTLKKHYEIKLFS